MWYVIWTLTGKEGILKQEIEAQVGNENYKSIRILTRERKQKRDGAWITRTEKLFPGYLFIEMEPEHVETVRMALWHATEHAKVVKTGENLLPIREEEERFLRRLVGDTTNVPISIGVIEQDKVIIREGPLKGMEGMIKYIDRHKRMAVLSVELFHRISEVKVGLEIVEKIVKE